MHENADSRCCEDDGGVFKVLFSEQEIFLLTSKFSLVSCLVLSHFFFLEEYALYHFSVILAIS